MSIRLENFSKIQLKKDLPPIKPGDVVKIYQKIKEKDKERIQAFEGVIIAKKHGKGISGTITVRKVVSGVGVERIFPIHSPMIDRIEILRSSKVRRAKLYFLREIKSKKSALKRKEYAKAIATPSAIKTEENNSVSTTDVTTPEKSGE
jgi:large subunit ribosomal protein L19